MRVFISNLGCKLNQAESERWARQFLAAGYTLAPSLEQADVHVINSCTVTHLAARDSRKLARRAGRLQLPARTVLTGCYASAEQAEARSLPGVDLVVANDDKERLVELVGEAFAPAAPAAHGGVPVGCVPLDFGPARAALKVEDGCNMRCSFCIIPLTRGRQRSRPIDDVALELQQLVAIGYREVVITGVQISSYRDRSSSSDGRLYDLVKTLLARTDIERLRLSSIAPWAFDARLLDLVAQGRVCRHFHLSLQSGSDRTLRRMRRPYSSEQFAALVGRVRDALPGVAITTDVIVGFPGESERDFELSKDFVHEVGFAKTHVFTYSSRPGTGAAELDEHVEPQIKKERTRRMLAVAQRSEREFQLRAVGSEVDVLWEDRWQELRRGTTDNYLRVLARPRSTQPPDGELDRVRIVGLGQHGLEAESCGSPRASVDAISGR